MYLEMIRKMTDFTWCVLVVSDYINRFCW